MGYTRHKAIILAVGLVAGLNAWAGTEFPAGPGEQVVANELIIRVKVGANANALIAGYLPGAQVQSLGRDPVFRISVPGGIPVGVSAQMAADLQVDYVEPNRVRHSTLAAPNDPNYASSWWFQTVQAVQAWSLLPGQYLTAATSGSGRVKVAVLDTGADCTHPDFINTGGSSTDAAQGGQLMFSVSHAYVATTISSPVCTWQDDHGHGTHVTGIVAAATSNAVGVSGLGYPVQVIEFKVLDSTGSGADTVISQAIKDAADAGAQVVSMSLGGAGYSQTLQDAVTYAWQKNTLVVAAAGNSASSSLFFPAGANHAVGVSATDSSNNLASFSNFGNSVQLAAPGVAILSTAPTYTASQGWLNYVSLSGTSMATPFVSALAGLMAMTTPNTTGQAILQRMEQTASSTTAGGGWGQNFGYGIINASSAVAGTLRPAANGAMAGQIVNASSPPVPVSGAQITVNSQTITTDSTGLYRFGTLPAGTYPVTVSATGFTTQSLSVTIAAGADTPFTVAIGVTYGKFTGAVTDQGAGVSGAIVQALSGGLITGVAVADLNGQYTLWVPGGTYDVRASAIGRITTTVPALTVSAGGTTSANLNLPRLGTIAGSVRDGNLNPVANAQLLITGGGFSAGAATDGNGNYSLLGIPSGTQNALTATATGFLASTQNGITVSADVTTNVNFTMVSSTVATPTFNPPGGSYTSTQNVIISSTTPLASIRYTTDGSTPSETVGTPYTTPVAVSSSLTLRAIAYEAGMTDSAVSSAAYTISGGGGSPWYNSSWTNRKPITVDHTKVSGLSSLSNFPLLFSVIDANLKTVANGGSVGKSDGTDILFTAADAVTKLSHEIERYNPATGELVAWVKVPALSPSADTSLYVYYGNAAAADQQDRINTWDSNYKIVNHLKDPSGPVLDSTSNANNATPSASGATLVSAGKMGSAYSFDGVTGMLTTPSNPSWNGGSSNYTVQLWVKFNATPTDYSAAVSAGGWGGPLSIWFTASGTSIFRMDSAGLCQTYGSLTPDTTTFHQLVMTYNGSQLVPYIDGVPANSYPPSCTGTTSFAANSLTLGGFNPGKMLPSTIDEFRISSSTRSPDWILTEFRNQNSPAAFYAVGSQQNSGTTPSQVATPTFNPPGGSYTSTQNVIISSTTPLASIRYTTDGSTPSETVGTPYTTPVAVSSSLTLRAIAYEAGMTDSAVSSAAYTISGGGGSPWYNSSWTNRKPITVDHTKVSGLSSLSNFPLLFSVIDANLKTVANGGSVGKSDGTDILFTAADAVTKLSHEIERYNPATGELVAWVKVPALSPSADTSLYVYYGNAAAADQQDRINTWDSNYKIVNHLKDPSGPVLDSTSNANNATPSASGATLVSAGKMGSAYSFDGVTGMLTTPSNPSWNGGSSNYTVQLWVKFNATPTDYSAAVSAGGWGGPLSIWFTASGTSIFRMDSAGLCQTYGSLTPDTTTFHQLVMTYNGSQLVPYIDGVPANSYPPSCTGTTSFAANSLTLGGFNPGKMLPSTIDEFRISSSTRSPDWILTEFRNQNSPAAFYAVGSQQNSGTTPSQVATPTFNPPGGSYTSTQNVIISSTTPLASIRYTTDGSTPSETVGTPYTTPVAVSSSLTLRAIAYEAGMTDSAVSSAAYTISGGGGSPWYNSSWTNRKPITVDHTKVSGLSSLSNFPLLFSVIDANLKTVANGGSVGKSDGTDILFTAADAVTKLSHEIERYNPATGELVAWVKVPALSPSADTSLYVYYGNAAAADQQDRINTWDSNYKIVNHLKDPSGPVLDSTSNANNATPSASGATLVSAGKMGSAYSFDGVTGMLTTPSNPSWNGGSSNYTVQLWVKFNATPTDYSAAVSAGGWGGPLSIWFTASGTSIFRMDSAGLCQTYGSLTPDTTTFHQLVMTYNGSQLVPYIDGVPANSYPPSCTGTTSFAANSLTLGGFNPGKMLPSTIDEFRISSSTRSPDWILTEFRNQNSPAAFYAVGPQQ